MVDWDAQGQALTQSARSRRHWVVKHSSGFCGVGHMMRKWKEWDTATCPRCNDPDETTSHVWTCSGGGADGRWEKSLADLWDWMTEQETAPELRDAICDYLRSWRDKSQVLAGHQCDFPGLQQAVHNQATIGWQAFFEGYLACDWAATQHTYYEWAGSRRTGRRWATEILKKLWNIAWDLWEHRNGYVHTDLQPAKKIEQMEKAVRQEFHLGSATLAVGDQPLFSKTIDQLLKSPYEAQQAWVDLVQAARQRACRRDRAAYRGERSFLRGWLGRDSGSTGLVQSSAKHA